MKSRAQFLRLLQAYDKAINDAMLLPTIRAKIKAGICAGKLRNELIEKFCPKK